MSYVIPGWEKTLMDMKAGEKRTVVIPSNLAYGANGAGGIIKPFSPLRFEMELVSVNRK
jgi:peptidylprolyl isomerase